MQCSDCKAAIETNGLWTRYNTPQCIHCTARLIKLIGHYPVTKDEITARRRVVLADATAYGHSEVEIRKMVKAAGMPVEPSK